MQTGFRLSVFACTILLAIGVIAQTPKIDITGLYSCEGTNPDGSPYTAVVGIIKLGDTHLVRWTLENDDKTMGVGVLQGNTFFVSYYGGHPDSPGLVVYTVGEKQLDGQWTMGAAGKLFKETLTKTTFIHPKPPQPTTKPVAPGTLTL